MLKNCNRRKRVPLPLHLGRISWNQHKRNIQACCMKGNISGKGNTWCADLQKNNPEPTLHRWKNWTKKNWVLRTGGRSDNPIRQSTLHSCCACFTSTKREYTNVLSLRIWRSQVPTPATSSTRLRAERRKTSGVLSAKSPERSSFCRHTGEEWSLPRVFHLIRCRVPSSSTLRLENEASDGSFFARKIFMGVIMTRTYTLSPA